MRQKARRQYYGRSTIAQTLRSAGAELARAIEISEKPPPDPLVESLNKVAALVDRAIEAERVYILGRKRLATKLGRQKKAIEDLLKEVQGVPITPDEKVTAKRERAKKKQQ